jgi:phosphoserine phosphatase
VNAQTADAVWARIEALSQSEPGGIVASDCDGTLWKGDVGEDMFHAFVDHGRFEPQAVEALRREAREHALSDAGTGPEIARRIYAAYLGGAFPEERVCELMTWCFAGWTRREVGDFARAVVDQGHLAARQHGEVMAVLERIRRAGIPLVLVSASPRTVVVEAASRFGFDAGQVVAARAAYEEDVMVAAVERPIPYGPGKVTRLREHLGGPRGLYAAFGDNVFDVALLATARVPVAVRPKPRLRAEADKVPGLVELTPL